MSASSSSYDVEITEWFDAIIHDKKHFTARYASKMSEVTGFEVDVIAKATVLVYIALLLVCQEAHYLSNAVLVIVPILLTFVHPDEKPSNTRLFIHWVLFGIMILFDRLLEFLPFYHVLKVALFLALYLPPSSPAIGKLEEKLKRE